MNRESRASVNLSANKIISPQGIQLNGSGPAVFREQASCFSVQVPVGFLKHWKRRKGTSGVQVWLLRADGTMVPQIALPFVFSIGSPGDSAMEYQFYEFPKVPESELASVVVNCNGRLYCHEIKRVREF